MRSVSQRAVTGLVYVCVFFGVVTAGVGVVGVIGVDSTTDVGDRIVSDELATATATASTARAMDAVYTAGERVLLSPTPATASNSLSLYEQLMPSADAQLTMLEQLHAGDNAAELAGIKQLASQWAAVRAALNPSAIAALTGPSVPLETTLQKTYAPVSSHLDELFTRENSDAQDGRAHARATRARTTWIIGLTVLIAELITVAVARLGAVRIRRSAEPGGGPGRVRRDAAAGQERGGGPRALQRHLERIIPDTNATVLNRNNSADRLEAVTALPAGSRADRDPAARRTAVVPRGAVGAPQRPGRRPADGCSTARSAATAPAPRPARR